MTQPPDLRIEDERFVELITQVNFLQRLLYVPYAVFTCAAVGILYGLLFSLPIVWMPFAAAKGIALLIVTTFIIWNASFASSVYIYTKNGINLNALMFMFVLVFFIFLTVPYLVLPEAYLAPLFLLSAGIDEYGGTGFFLLLYILGGFITGLLWLATKTVEKSTEQVTRLSQMELKQPYGENFEDYRNLPTALSEYFADLNKVMKKRSSRNIFKQWYVKWSAMMAGCMVILYLPFLIFIAVGDLIGKLNLAVQIWGVYQILRWTTPHKIRKAHQVDTP